MHNSSAQRSNTNPSSLEGAAVVGGGRCPTWVAQFAVRLLNCFEILKANPETEITFREVPVLSTTAQKTNMTGKDNQQTEAGVDSSKKIVQVQETNQTKGNAQALYEELEEMDFGAIPNEDIKLEDEVDKQESDPGSMNSTGSDHELPTTASVSSIINSIMGVMDNRLNELRELQTTHFNVRDMMSPENISLLTQASGGEYLRSTLEHDDNGIEDSVSVDEVMKTCASCAYCGKGRLEFQSYNDFVYHANHCGLAVPLDVPK